MNWKRGLGWTAAVLLVVGVAALAGGYWYLKTSSFQRYAIAKIVQTKQESTGGKLDVQNLDFNLRTLRANLYGVTLHGTEHPSQPPLLQADRLSLAMKIDSVLRRKLSLAELLIVHPVVHLTVDQNGNTNIPTPPPSKHSSSTSVFDLAVRHALLSRGEIYLNDERTPFAADVRDLNIESKFDFLRTAYQGSVTYGNADLQYGRYQPLSHALEVQFTATPSLLTIDPLKLRIASSSAVLKTKIENYSQPKLEGTYSIQIHGPDAAQLLGNVKLEGDVALDGGIKYQSAPNLSFLEAAEMAGRVSSGGLSARTSGEEISVQRLQATYQLSKGQLRSDDIRAELLNGQAHGTLLIRDLQGEQAGDATLKMAAISLASVKRTVQNAQLDRLPVTGTLAGETRASWVGSLKNVRLSSELRLKGAIWDETKERAPRFPLDGVAHVSYDGRHNSIVLSRTSLHAASVSLSLQGVLGDHSNLQVGALAPDLGEVTQLISLLQQAQTPAPKQVDVSGAATLKAVVQGSMRRPHVSGNVEGQNLAVQGSRWTTVKFGFEADPSQASVRNLSLVNARQGDVSGSFQLSLDNWSYDAKNPVRGDVTVRRMSIADLQHLGGVDYPIAGDLSASMNISGSQLDPAGQGQMQISDGKAYGEPFRVVTAKFNAAKGAIHSTMDATLPAGSAHAEVRYSPTTKAYSFSADAPAIVLEKLTTVQQKNLDMAGTVNAVARGEGTLDDPQLIATIQVPHLQLKRTAVTGIRGDLSVAAHRATVSLTSDVQQAHVDAHGYVNLTPDRYSEFVVDTNKVPLEPFVVLYAPSVPEGFKGETELHATLKGPLQDSSKVEAHLTVKTLRAQYQNVSLESPAPIRADYSHSEVTLQPGELKGTGTSIHWQGKAGSSAVEVNAKGSIDMQILKIFQPDMKCGGSINFDVQTSGTLHAPQVKGQVHLQDVAVVTADAPMGVENLSGDIDLDSEKAQIRNIVGRVGGGQVTIGGSVEFRPDVLFNVSLNGESVRLRYPTGVRTLLDTKLVFTGNMQASALTGRVLIDSLSFTPEFDLSSFVTQFDGPSIGSTGDTFADTVKLAIGVQSSQNLNATSAQLSLEGTANLRVIGTAAEPVIVGRADVTSGELFFRNNRYQLQRGLVTFNNPSRTEPFLNVAATTTIQQYNLTVTMNGPIDKLNTSYVSDPPLATADVINLLASGQTTQEASANSSTDSILAGQVASQFSGNIQKLAGLSSLEIDPLIGGNNTNPSARIAVQQRVTKNLLFTFSTDVTQPGNEIVQGDYQINRRWSVSVSRDQLGGVSVDGRYHTKF